VGRRSRTNKIDLIRDPSPYANTCTNSACLYGALGIVHNKNTGFKVNAAGRGKLMGPGSLWRAQKTMCVQEIDDHLVILRNGSFWLRSGFLI